MQFRLTLALMSGRSTDLVWDLNDRPWTRAWSDLTRRALEAGHRPSGLQVVARRTDRELAELRSELRAVAVEASGLGFLPHALLDLDITAQDTLNAMHAARHLSEADVPPIMERINILVHTIESATRIPEGGYLVSYLSGDAVMRDSIEHDWLMAGDTPGQFGDLKLGYATVGKRLVHCFFDHDEQAVVNRLVRLQQTFCSEILADFRPPWFEPNMRDMFAAWCRAVGADEAGYPWQGTAHGTMHLPVLGSLVWPKSFTPLAAQEMLGQTVAVSGFAFL